jgi:hypothetical protein
MGRFVLAGTVAAILFLVCGASQALAEENAFPNYPTVSEVPLVGHFPAKASRHGPIPTPRWVRLTTRNVRIFGGSDVRCHGIPGRLVACRAHLGKSVGVRLLVRTLPRFKEIVASCQTLSGTLNTGACFDYTVWEFNWTENGL